MEISKEKDLYVFRKKAEEVMENTEKIFEKIKEQGKRYEKSKIGNLVLKEERIKRLNQFKDMVGLEDLKKSGNTRQWLIDGLINQIEKYELSEEELNALIAELNKMKQPNKQQSSEKRDER